MAGNYLGIDYGERRWGLSFADADLLVATPIAAITAKTAQNRLDDLLLVLKERQIGTVVVGLPLNMDGTVGHKAKEVEQFIQQLSELTGLVVIASDERLTSYHANMEMQSMGLRKKRASVRNIQKLRQSGDLDSRAATLILQAYLDERGLA